MDADAERETAGVEPEAPGLAVRLLGRLPPIDGVVEEPDALRAEPPPDLAARVAASLAGRTGATGALLRRSAGDALRVALRAAAAHTRRDEVVLPACGGAALAAGALAAGLRVRLVDVDERGAVDPVSLALLPIERAACIVVSSPFGLAEPVAPLAAVASPRGAWLLDHAVHAFGATASDGPAGARGELGVLGFGAGEPLQALGGGAVVWRAAALRAAAGAPVAPRPLRAWWRARAWNAALGPLVGAALAATPLRVGALDAGAPRGPIAGDVLVLCAHALARIDARQARREAEALSLARDVRTASAFAPVVPPPGARGAFPRLALRAPDRARREAAVRALARFGAARAPLVPLDADPGLRRLLVELRPAPGARTLVERTLTLPVHGALRGTWRERVLDTLAQLAPPDP